MRRFPHFFRAPCRPVILQEEDEDGGGYAGLGDEASPGTDGSGQFLTQVREG